MMGDTVVELRQRTAEHVRIYFEKTQDVEIMRRMPSAAGCVEDALKLFYETKKDGATSYGRTIYYKGQYVGDIWCYCIDKKDTPNAMLSYCIFEKALWGKGIATQAVSLFLPHVQAVLGLESMGAFTYADNLPSIAVLAHNGFEEAERFEEDGLESVYMETRQLTRRN